MDLDETVETIIDIFNQEVLIHLYDKDIDTDVEMLNIKGVLRERIKNVLQKDDEEKLTPSIGKDKDQWADDLQHAINGIIFNELNDLDRDEIQAGFNETHTALTIILERLKILSKEDIG